MFPEGFTVEYVNGDLSQAGTEGIVVNVNVELDLNYRMRKAVLARAGEELKTELDRIHREKFGGENVLLGTTVSTGPHSLPPPVRRIIFTAWWNRDNEYTSNLIFKCVTGAIREADKHCLRSVSFPLLGRGGRLAHGTIAEGFAKAINQLAGLEHHFTIERLCLVSIKREDLDGVAETLDDLLDL